MNIAFFDATPKWSGGANRVLFLAKGLKSSSHEPLIVCLPGSVLSERAKLLRINVVKIKPLSDLGLISFFRILHTLKKYRIDIIDINSPKFYWLALYAAKIIGTKVILTRNVPYRKRGIKKLLNGLFLYKQCDMVISLSDKVRAELENDFGIKNIRVIYDGLLNEPKPIVKNESLTIRQRFGFLPNDIVFATIGRIEENKGQIFAVKAFERVTQQNRNIKLLIVGSGDESYEKKIEKFIREKNLSSNIVVAGFVDDISDIYAAMDILLQPSLYDNIPLTILEAYSYKKPVIASRVGGIPEIVEDGVTGYLTEPSNPQDLAEKIIKMINSNYKSMGQKGFEIIRRKFSKENMFDNYRKILNELMQT